jgi:uncharacterized protein
MVAKIAAHPALWTVHTKNATAYLLGSIHLLPANVEWRTPEIETALRASDVFVFEAPTDETGKATAADFMSAHGTLPPELALPSLLNDEELKDYRQALALTHVPPDSLVHMRPWLAALVLEVAFIRGQHYEPNSGIDHQVALLATAEGKPLRYFETVTQQLSLLMPQDQKLELAQFDATLKEFQSAPNELGPLVDAWAHSRVAEVDRLMNKDLESVPGAKKALIDDRNDAWVVKLGTMLKEHHTYFITVGAGHLAGPHGLPALLRKTGYSVEGP